MSYLIMKIYVGQLYKVFTVSSITEYNHKLTQTVTPSKEEKGRGRQTDKLKCINRNKNMVE